MKVMEDFSQMGQSPATNWMGKTIYAFHEIESTNDTAAKYASEGVAEGTVVIADAQTKGRGRQGGKWFSPPGVGLWCSIILRPACTPAQAPLLTQVAAGAVQEAVQKLCGIRLEIKYPNDLMWLRRKVCGILTESSGKGHVLDWVVVGIGLNVNVNNEDFPLELQALSTSLNMAVGAPVSRPKLFGLILRSFELRYEEWRKRLEFR